MSKVKQTYKGGAKKVTLKSTGSSVKTTLKLPRNSKIKVKKA